MLQSPLPIWMILIPEWRRCLWHIRITIPPPFIHSFIHSSIHSSIHQFIHQFLHQFILHFIHSFIHSFLESSISSSIHACIHRGWRRKKSPNYLGGWIGVIRTSPNAADLSHSPYNTSAIASQSQSQSEIRIKSAHLFLTFESEESWSIMQRYSPWSPLPFFLSFRGFDRWVKIGHNSSWWMQGRMGMKIERMCLDMRKSIVDQSMDRLLGSKRTQLERKCHR
jgi:hypothetical protein